MRILETFRDPINRVLRLLGYDTSTEDDTANVTPARRRSARFHGIAVRQIFDAGLLVEGERLISTNGSWPASAVITADGAINYNSHQYDTPSGAAMAVKNGPANGWDFWAVERPEGSERLSTLRNIFAARELDYLDRPAGAVKSLGA